MASYHGSTCYGYTYHGDTCLLYTYQMSSTSGLHGNAGLYLPSISPISPPYLPYISPISPLYLLLRGVALEHRLKRARLLLHLGEIQGRYWGGVAEM